MSSRHKRANRIVYLALALLLVVMAVLAYFNRGDPELRRALEENREFHIRIGGEHAATVSLQMLIDLGPVEFATPFATSITASREAMMRGVELRLLLDALEIDYSGASRITVSGLDGYHTPLSSAEVAGEGVVYICYSMDGEIMRSQAEGGFGPFMMVIRGARFAQRWCKYVEAVDVVW